ncbi:MAG TPA: hypothetical protein DD451_04365 [Candidatus Moranbacteria bacterium]|nr:hypothetical protein [Candidatus Moranbacteria bacterium]
MIETSSTVRVSGYYIGALRFLTGELKQKQKLLGAYSQSLFEKISFASRFPRFKTKIKNKILVLLSLKAICQRSVEGSVC